MISMSLADYRQLSEVTKAKGPAKNKGNAKVQAAKLAQEVELNLLELPGYKKEHIFHPTRKWRFDYAWLDIKVALEIHGGVFTNGRHTRGAGFTEDKVKMNEAQLLGWIVIEATTKQVKDGQMLNWITQAIESRKENARNNTNW